MAISLYIYLGIYIFLLLTISYIISRKQTKEDFLIGNRDRGGWQIFASKFAAAIGAAYFITYTGFAYEYGLGVFALILGGIFGYLIFAYWAAPKIHLDSKENKFYTFGHFVYHKTKNKFSMYLSEIISSVVLLGWTLIGIIGGAKIISEFGSISYNFAVVLISLIVLLYILIAGYRAVLVTDLIQSIIIVILLVIITFGIIGSSNFSTLFSVKVEGIDLGTTIGFFLFGILSVFCYADRYQLCYAAKNKRKLKHGLGLAIIPILFAAFLLLLIGLFMALKIPGLDPGLVFAEALKNFLPVSLLPFAIVLFLAGIMSSVDTGIYGISSHYAIHKKGDPVQKIRKTTIWLVILIAFLSILFPNVVDVSVLVGGFSLILSFPMIYLLFDGKKSSRFIGSAFGGVIGLIVGVILVGIEPSVALFVLFGEGLGLLYNPKRF
jgi:Na+/proline symporter